MGPARLSYMGLGMPSFQVVGGLGDDASAETDLVAGPWPHGEGNAPVNRLGRPTNGLVAMTALFSRGRHRRGPDDAQADAGGLDDVS